MEKKGCDREREVDREARRREERGRNPRERARWRNSQLDESDSARRGTAPEGGVGRENEAASASIKCKEEKA